MEYITYTAKEGERWDTISQRAYGRPDLFPGILAANTDVPFSPRLAASTELQIPILEVTAAEPAADMLPPWKRT